MKTKKQHWCLGVFIPPVHVPRVGTVECPPRNDRRSKGTNPAARDGPGWWEVGVELFQKVLGKGAKKEMTQISESPKDSDYLVNNINRVVIKPKTYLKTKKLLKKQQQYIKGGLLMPSSSAKRHPQKDPLPHKATPHLPDGLRLGKARLGRFIKEFHRLLHARISWKAPSRSGVVSVLEILLSISPLGHLEVYAVEN